ncbi:CHAT domain-containing protein [Microbacterium sp. SLBN-146]|uniref:DUF7363 domain-containing protein n=1 Tax=Microbacterium sp. SLBN-146 TaxID=2768457 RepID=UPI0011514785|nr:CHAT domain-containing protein [Microbacterium sp. SLBN-146]TQJ30801.1 CHAT domain-containing protein [Microbacterium sp. SLBN-146]
MRVPTESPQQVGAVTIAIDGPALVHVPTSHAWTLLQLGLPWLVDATVLVTFEVVRTDRSGDAVTLVIDTPREATRLLAVVRTTAMTFAIPAWATDAGGQWVFETGEGAASVHVLELRDEAAVTTGLDWFGGPPGFGAAVETQGAEEAEHFPVEAEFPEHLPVEAEFPEHLPVEHFPDEPGDADVGARQPSGSRVPLPDAAAPAPPPPAPSPPPAPAPTPAPAPEASEQPTGDEEKTTAHIAAEMPRTALVGDVVTLDVLLSRSEIVTTPGFAADRRIIAVAERLPLTVSISVRGYRLASGRATRTVRLLATRAARRRFRLEATDDGPGEVSIVVRQRSETPLATLRLTTRIGGGTGGERATATTDARDPESDVLVLPVLRIDESTSRGRSTLDVAVQIGDDQERAVVRGLDKAAVIASTYARIDALRTRLEEDRSGDVPTRVDVALHELRAIGVELSRQLLPLRVRRLLWTHRDRLDSLVVQTTGEFDVPWELVYVSDPDRSANAQPLSIDGFLGMRGATRWVYNTALPTRIEIAGTRAKYLCPSYRDSGLSLTFSATEATLVRRVFRAKAVRPGDATAMSKVISEGFDLLHFGGHGVWIADPPDQRLLFANYRRSGTPPQGSSYSASELREILPDLQMVGAADSRGMVFLNACDVGRMDTSAPGLGGFPEAFLRGGVGLLIGCSWAIDDEAASQFVRDFYDALSFTDVAGAVVLARRKALANADLTALAYVAYAHPRAHVVPV